MNSKLVTKEFETETFITLDETQVGEHIKVKVFGKQNQT